LQAVIFAVNFTWYFPCSFTQNHNFLLFSWPGGAFWRLGGSFWRPGGSFWRPGAPFWRFLGLLWFSEHSGHEKVVPFWDKFEQVFNFLQCYFLMFFRVLAFSMFCDFGCPEAPFWCHFLRYFESPGPLKKPSKLCNCYQFQRFGPFQIQSFCKSWLRVRFHNVFFRCLWFLAVLGLPF
jgi:hypothetical protein